MTKNEYKQKALQFIAELRDPAQRAIMHCEAADSQGRLNGITIVELLAMVNMARLNGERLVIQTAGAKRIQLTAEKYAPSIPEELTA